MQKLKKALKKLAGLAEKTAPKTKSVQQAKKASATKKKTQSLAAAKKPAKKAAPTKKAAPAPAKKTLAVKGKAAPPAKADLKKKTAAPAKPTAPAKVQVAPKVAGKKAAEVLAPTAKVAGNGKAGAAAPVQGKKPAPTPEAIAASEKKAKGKKDRADVEALGAAQAAANEEEEVILTDADGRRYCRVKDCDQAAAVGGGYCRFHYLLFWKNIQNRKKILSEGKLERYVEELTARYPDKYLELLRKDLRSEKDFMAAIQELEIDESAVDNEMEDEAQNYLDEVRGMSSESQPEREEDF